MLSLSNRFDPTIQLRMVQLLAAMTVCCRLPCFRFELSKRAPLKINRDHSSNSPLQVDSGKSILLAVQKKGAVDLIPFAQKDKKGLRLTLHVQPGASKSEIAGLFGEALKLRIAARAEEGAANKAICE